jgi:ER membrane protein complex subunit 3
LRATSSNSPLPFSFYRTISQNLSKAFAEGTYLKDGPPKGDSPSAPPNPLSDPAAMDGMMAGMKTQMVMMVPQMVIMGWINFFFQGFVLSRSGSPYFNLYLNKRNS